mmetsp:Transcript_49908/g.97654  ORF Transcript_49908/g.97654 Transcript_49908/m.97654 type:complete len:324 (+) Transcript_49908:257-1228(+)|eukprot:CAMPEP_0194332876 /NCGR_PEP_ID=MMETSP0171-20130528/60635_1 /TAXON_ID=218684 /ORGANISM="Corethron pennatum, Strain L29A3" /LENGTH=323 /DNA_ID=CAMNT_0039094897 /DNA_START=202 /DNA_END=1173 /DNA_ORIENTATION=-
MSSNKSGCVHKAASFHPCLLTEYGVTQTAPCFRKGKPVGEGCSFNRNSLHAPHPSLIGVQHKFGRRSEPGLPLKLVQMLSPRHPPTLEADNGAAPIDTVPRGESRPDEIPCRQPAVHKIVNTLSKFPPCQRGSALEALVLSCHRIVHGFGVPPRVQPTNAGREAGALNVAHRVRDFDAVVDRVKTFDHALVDFNQHGVEARFVTDQGGLQLAQDLPCVMLVYQTARRELRQKFPCRALGAGCLADFSVVGLEESALVVVEPEASFVIDAAYIDHNAALRSDTIENSRVATSNELRIFPLGKRPQHPDPQGFVALEGTGVRPHR